MIFTCFFVWVIVSQSSIKLMDSVRLEISMGLRRRFGWGLMMRDCSRLFRENLVMAGFGSWKMACEYMWRQLHQMVFEAFGGSEKEIWALSYLHTFLVCAQSPTSTYQLTFAKKLLYQNIRLACFCKHVPTGTLMTKKHCFCVTVVETSTDGIRPHGLLQKKKGAILISTFK